MSEEYLDIVDENNIPTGAKELRSIVHENGDYHRVSLCYIFKKIDGNFYFLVHLRSDGKDLNPGKWSTRFGGHLKSGQTYDETIIDELKDELNLNLKITDLLKGSIISTKGADNCFSQLYFYEILGNENALIFSDEEVQEIKWMKVEDIIDDFNNNPDKWSGSTLILRKIVEDIKTLVENSGFQPLTINR